MSKKQPSEALIQLHQILASRSEYLNEMELAIALSCSPKFVLSLIDELRQTYKAPIHSEDSPLRFRYTEPFELSHNQLAASDWQQIATVINLLSELNERHQSIGFKNVRQVFTGILLEQGLQPEKILSRVRVLGRQFKAVTGHITEAVADAVFQRQQLQIHYASAKQQISERVVSPQRLVLYREQWYLDAWCHQREDIRTFLLARINSALVTPDTALEFEDEQLDAHLQRQYGLLSGQDIRHAQLRFFNRGAVMASQQQWHPDATGHWQGDDYLMTLPYSNDGELLGDLLALAPDIEVIAPDTLRQAMIDRLQQAIVRYR